jgi:hypothetical protein
LFDGLFAGFGEAAIALVSAERHLSDRQDGLHDFDLATTTLVEGRLNRAGSAASLPAEVRKMFASTQIRRGSDWHRGSV